MTKYEYEYNTQTWTSSIKPVNKSLMFSSQQFWSVTELDSTITYQPVSNSADFFPKSVPWSG